MKRNKALLCSFVFFWLGVYSLPLSSVTHSKENSAPSKKKSLSTVVEEAPPPPSPMAPGSHNLSLGLGQVFLMGDLGNGNENALGVHGNYTYGVSELFAFQSDFGYSSHSNGSFSQWHLGAGLRTNLIYFDQLVPYFNIGLGFYHPSRTYANNVTASGLLFGMQLGAGVDLFITRRVFFGTSLTFHDMFDSTKTASDQSQKPLGGSFIAFLLHAGVTF